MMHQISLMLKLHRFQTGRVVLGKYNVLISKPDVQPSAIKTSHMY